MAALDGCPDSPGLNISALLDTREARIARSSFWHPLTWSPYFDFNIHAALGKIQLTSAVCKGGNPNTVVKRLSAVGWRLSAVGHRLSAFSFQQLAISN
jgi:hypothetical protein